MLFHQVASSSVQPISDRVQDSGEVYRFGFCVWIAVEVILDDITAARSNIYIRAAVCSQFAQTDVHRTDPRVNLLGVKLVQTLLLSNLPVVGGDDGLMVGFCYTRDKSLHRGETTCTSHKTKTLC